MSFILKHFFPSMTWHIPTEEKILYLTFDDGPIPVVTPWVLETLREYSATATFFCVGENVKKHPEVMKELKNSHHSIGNHTMNHLNGWKTPNEKYYSNIDECKKYIQSELFRPPYGKIKISQMNFLKKDFKIIMWDVLSRDYDTSISGEQCFENVKQNAGKGSIVVFHDSLKAEARLRIALPATLKYFSELGFSFKSLSFN
jgi:peptidoglycan/xylan/chitin deacetylase (PgdA/CDA1 family)